MKFSQVSFLVALFVASSLWGQRLVGSQGSVSGQGREGTFGSFVGEAGATLSEAGGGEADKDRYIVILPSLPTAKRYSIELQKELTSLALEAQKKQHQKTLKNEQDTALRKIAAVLNRPVDVILKDRYINALNGVLLQLSESEYQKLTDLEKKLGIQVFPDTPIESTLFSSVASMQEGVPAGQLDEDGNNCSASGKTCLTGKGVIVGVIDSGIDYGHPVFGACTEEVFLSGNCEKVIGGMSFFEGEDPNDPTNGSSHGTRVASIIAGDGEVSVDGEIIELRGVAPGAQLIAYRTGGIHSSSSRIIAALEVILGDNNGLPTPHILSMSVGGYGGPENPLPQAMDNAVSAGIVVVVAAGNGGDNSLNSVSGPAASQKAITVGAVGLDNKRADFSGRGPVIWRNEEGNDFNATIKPEVMAPGVSILSATRSSFTGELVYSASASQGTSLSAPHVSGAIAVLLEKHPEWTPEEVRSAIMKTATPNGEDLVHSGHGIVNLSALLSLEEQGERPLIAELPDARWFFGVSPREQGTILIRGTATGVGFTSYKIFSSGEESSDWLEHCSRAEPVTEDILCEMDLSGLAPGRHQLKLEVYGGAGKIYRAFNSIFIRNSVAVSNCTELQNMRDDLTADYYLTNDIDCSETADWNGGQGFLPVGGGGEPFWGSLDGAGHHIQALTINRPDTFEVGLFGSLGLLSSVKNVGLVGSDITGFRRSGGIAGDLSWGIISRVYSSGSLNGERFSGALIGRNLSGILRESYSEASVNATGYSVGGLVGHNINGFITHSYATGNVHGLSTAIGGLVGTNSGGLISDSYSTGHVGGDAVLGGLVGRNETHVSQHIFGVSNSFWDKQSSGQSTSQGGVGKTTLEMMTQATYTDVEASEGLEQAWSFGDIWRIDEGESTPYLIWSASCPADLNGDGVVNASDLGLLLGCFGSHVDDANWSSCSVADLNGDGVISAADLGIFLGYWGGQEPGCL